MKHSKIFLGILLLLVAVGIILYAFVPDLLVISMPIWKILVGIILIYWIFDNLITRKKFADKIDIFFPLAFMFLLFQNELNSITKINLDNIYWWTPLIVALLLSISVHLIFGSGSSKKVEIEMNTNDSNNLNEESRSEEQEIPKAKEKIDETKNEYSYSFGNATCYIDATKNNNKVKNIFGLTNVYFNNIDLVNGNEITLETDNAFGKLVINLPEGWSVYNHIDNSLGDVNCRRVTYTCSKNVIVKGNNVFGETVIR